MCTKQGDGSPATGDQHGGCVWTFQCDAIFGILMQDITTNLSGTVTLKHSAVVQFGNLCFTFAQIWQQRPLHVRVCVCVLMELDPDW